MVRWPSPFISLVVFATTSSPSFALRESTDFDSTAFNVVPAAAVEEMSPPPADADWLEFALPLPEASVEDLPLRSLERSALVFCDAVADVLLCALTPPLSAFTFV